MGIKAPGLANSYVWPLPWALTLLPSFSTPGISLKLHELSLECSLLFFPQKSMNLQQKITSWRNLPHVFGVVIRGWSDHCIKSSRQLPDRITALILSATRTFPEPPPSARCCHCFNTIIHFTMPTPTPFVPFTLKGSCRTFCTFQITFLAIFC